MEEPIYSVRCRPFAVVYRRKCKNARRCRGPLGEYLVRDTRSGETISKFLGGSAEDFAFDGRAHRRAIDRCMELNAQAVAS